MTTTCATCQWLQTHAAYNHLAAQAVASLPRVVLLAQKRHPSAF